MRRDRRNGQHGATSQEALTHERVQLVQRLEDWLETPMLVLAFVWLALLVLELIWGASALFETVGLGIWGIFILNFLLEFTLTPRKVAYLKSNSLTALSLLVPALRVFRLIRVLRVLRMARAARGLRLLRIVSSLNRSMGALGASLNRRRFAYVVALTLQLHNRLEARRLIEDHLGQLDQQMADAGVNYSHRCPKGNRQMRRVLNQAAPAEPQTWPSCAVPCRT